MKTQKRKTGDVGEAIAIRFLQEKGFSLVEQNYLKPFGEIDLVMKKGSEMFFVEVKTGKIGSDWDPEQNLDRKKLGKFERIVKHYITEKKLDTIKNRYGVEQELEYQMWAVVVYLDEENKKAQVKLIDELYY